MVTLGPVPLMSGWTTSFVGGFTPAGILIVAAFPSVTLTVGSPAFGGTAVPVALGSGAVVVEQVDEEEDGVGRPDVDVGVPRGAVGVGRAARR